MPGVTPIRPDDVRSARAWAAFVADDAAATAPPSLEARIMRAAQTALAQQRVEAERKRRQWFTGLSAIAAGLLAAATWSLAPSGSTHSRVKTPADAARAATIPESPVTAPAGSSAQVVDEPAGRPVPMMNIEAGRVMATPPLLASRPLFDHADGAGPVGAPGDLRAKSYGAPLVGPIAIAVKHDVPMAAPADHTSPTPLPLTATPGVLAGTAPEVWSSRAKPVFDAEGGEIAPPAPIIRLDTTAPATTREDPPAPPK